MSWRSSASDWIHISSEVHMEPVRSWSYGSEKYEATAKVETDVYELRGMSGGSLDSVTPSFGIGSVWYQVGLNRYLLRSCRGAETTYSSHRANDSGGYTITKTVKTVTPFVNGVEI